MDNGSKQSLAKSIINNVAKSLRITVTSTIGIESNAINGLVLHFCDHVAMGKEALRIENCINHHHGLLMVINIYDSSYSFRRRRR